MAKLTGIFRIGRDAEVRRLNDGTAVVNLALATNYGKKGEDGNRPTQWVDAAFFGDRAEKLAPYLLKGNQIGAFISDIHIESYEGKNGTAHKLVGRVDDIELTDRKDGAHAAQPQRNPEPRRQEQGGYRSSGGRPAPGSAPAQKPPADDFSDFESDVPF